MKLRNKKTGEVRELFNNTGGILPNTLAELIKEWEDYKPAEQYIDNELVRALLKNWAYVNKVDKVEYNTYPTGDCSFVSTYYNDKEGIEIELLLDFRDRIDNLIGGKIYTIAELCRKGKNER